MSLSWVVTFVEVWCESRRVAGPMPCAVPCGRAAEIVSAVAIDTLHLLLPPGGLRLSMQRH